MALVKNDRKGRGGQNRFLVLPLALLGGNRRSALATKARLVLSQEMQPFPFSQPFIASDAQKTCKTWSGALKVVFAKVKALGGSQ